MSWHVRPGGSIVVTLRLTLHPGRDDDLIAIIQQAQKGQLATIVRETMRSGIIQHSKSADNVEEDIHIEVDVWEL